MPDIKTLQISYPDFRFGEVIDPEQIDANNSELMNKINEITPVLNISKTNSDNNTQLYSDLNSSMSQYKTDISNEVDTLSSNFNVLNNSMTSYKNDITSKQNSLEQRQNQVIAGVTSDSEIQDSRVSYDGVSYTTLGEHLRALGNQLKDISYKSITEYKQDGDLDYTEAFKRYFADLKAGNKITLKINVPLCIISSQIIMPFNNYISIVGDGAGNTIRYIGAPDTDVFYCNKGTETGNIYLTGEIKNLRFETSVSNVTMFKEVVAYTSLFTFKDCVFSGFYYAIVFDRAYWTSVSGCDIINGTNGLLLYNANSCRIFSSYFRFLSGTGITFDNNDTVHPTSAGVNVTNTNYEKVEEGIRIKSTLYGACFIGNYFECNKDKYSFNIVEPNGTITNTTFSGNFARTDNMFNLTSCDSVTFSGGHLGIIFPNTSNGKIKKVILINSNEDYINILNSKYHDGEIYDMTFVRDGMAWQPLTSNHPVTINKDEIRVPAHGTVKVAETKALRTFRLLNFYADNIWQIDVKVIKDGAEVFTKKTDKGEGNALHPLYKEDLLSSAKVFSIVLSNNTNSEIVLKFFTLTYISNLYHS